MGNTIPMLDAVSLVTAVAVVAGMTVRPETAPMSATRVATRATARLRETTVDMFVSLDCGVMKSVADAVEYLTTRSTEEPLKSLAKRFADEGYELALVGGPVRDAFLGRAITGIAAFSN